MRCFPRKFPFPFEKQGNERKRHLAQASVKAPLGKELHAYQGFLWKTSWKEAFFPKPPADEFCKRASKWLFCGVPSDYVPKLRGLLRSSGIQEAMIIEASDISTGSTLPRLPSGEAVQGVIFVGGMCSSFSSTACIEALRQVLLAYCKTAEEDPTFSPSFSVIAGTNICTLGGLVSPCFSSQSEDLDIRHSGLLGVCRTARLEIQRLCRNRFTLLYVNVGAPENVSALTKAWSWIDVQFGLLRGKPLAAVEEDVAILETCYVVPRLEPVSVAHVQRRITISSSNSYVITGGTGGLGLAVAQWLLKQGAGNVVLLSRSGKPADLLRQTRAWEVVETAIREKRAGIMVCDVASQHLTQNVLSIIHRQLPVKGIFHCAGFEGEAKLAASSLRSIHAVYEPKAKGAWNLHIACHQLHIEKTLDLFVLFSSTSALPGNDALATYAAANAYLDSLAHWRRSQGLQAQSIQWGPWLDVGMVTRNEKFERVFKSRGIQPFRSEDGVKVMTKALQTNEPCICALKVDWKKYVQSFAGQIPRALIDMTADKQQASVDSRADSADAPSRKLIETVVLEAANSLAGVGQELTSDTRFDALGLDSLGSVELRNLIQERLAISLPASLLLEFASLGEVIEFIAEELQKRPSADFHSSVSPPKASPIGSDGFAVIGMGCRLPGNSDSPEEFWKMLQAGTDCVADIPWQRFNIQPLFDPNPDENKCYVKEAALLDNAHLFDNRFFRMSESQARNVDPQQRVLLEVAYETLVDAQYTREAVKGQDIGVFCATYTNEYQLTSLTRGESGILAIGEGADGGVPRLGEASGYPEPGGLMCLIPNRISYSFGLTGPSIGVDTACASGLVALDTAMMKLRLSGCSKAFVGAVSLILAPCFFLGGSKTRQFSKSGRCRTFDAAADGLVRGEGAAGVLLAPLPSARAESKFVHAVVRGTATSHYGQGARLTAPNTRALVRVLNLALHDSEVEQSMVRCYEAHGTATVLGDIIEMNALKRVFENRSAAAPLVVGTAHNNIGHLDSAAALVALIKTILSLKHHYVPPNIQFTKLHPDIAFFDTTKIIYTKEAQVIRRLDESSRLFGANLAYGLGGTVVAAITEEGDDPAGAPTVSPSV